MFQGLMVQFDQVFPPGLSACKYQVRSFNSNPNTVRHIAIKMASDQPRSSMNEARMIKTSNPTIPLYANRFCLDKKNVRQARKREQPKDRKPITHLIGPAGIEGIKLPMVSTAKLNQKKAVRYSRNKDNFTDAGVWFIYIKF
jgi:hypothetical protein